MVSRVFHILNKIGSFLPIHILFGLLKYNILSLFYWVLLFSIVSGNFGASFGIPSLFFSPEYRGEVTGWSFAFLGFSFGGFSMAFHTYSYIRLGPRYHFLALVSRPFMRFCVNNSLIPLVFLVYYLFRLYVYQTQDELVSGAEAFSYIVFVLLGYAAFMLLSIFYFFPTTRDKVETDQEDEDVQGPIQSVTQKKDMWYDYFRKEKQRVFYFVGKNFRIYRSRSTEHIDREIIEQVFAKNRINASIFVIISILSFLSSSLLVDLPYFELPAGMSFVLLLTLIHMLFSALMSWFHRWTYPLLILLIVIMNTLSIKTTLFNYRNYAYGLSYDQGKLTKYSNEAIRDNCLCAADCEKSFQTAINALENWKRNTGHKKPKLVILNTSGGGSRSALWTFTILQKCDEAMEGRLSRNLKLITGASGGMLGAAYYRQLCLMERESEVNDRFSQRYTDRLGSDLLNKISFSITTTDMFFRYQTFDYEGKTYTKDRGYAFEQHVSENLKGVFNHNLSYYQKPEDAGLVPQMIFSPTVVNDGRRMLIGASSLSFLTSNKNQDETFENIDYQSFFKKNKPGDVRFATVIRSSATFPFIMPMVTLPTSPDVQLMDAGIRDNYGKKVAVLYLNALQSWIKKNTSGVVILEIRDTKRILKNDAYEHISLMDKITLPFGNMYNNFPKTQDYDQDQLLNTAKQAFSFPIDVVTFNLRESKRDKISLSWHLTAQEKVKIANSLYSKQNQLAFKRLIELLNTK